MSEVQDEGNVVSGCESEVQGEGIVVYSDMCLRNRVRELLFTVMFVRGKGEGIVVHSDVCLRYRVRELLCTVMFV